MSDEFVFTMPATFKIALRLGPEALSPRDRHVWIEVGRFGCVESAHAFHAGDGELREELRDLGVIERRQVDQGPSYEDFLTGSWHARYADALRVLDCGWQDATSWAAA